MDLANMTLEEVSLMYGKYIGDNIGIFSNEQLANLLNHLTSLHAESAKQYAKNLQNEKKSNQDILNASLKLDEVMKLNSEKHSKNEVVTLNVGGRLFATFKWTLMNYEHSYFFALLNSGIFLPGADGSYFIDRSPTHFELIIDYLRNGEFSKKKLKIITSLELEELIEECDYYLLPIPIMQWDLSPSRKPVNASFSEGNLKITKTGGYNWNCPVIGSSPVSEFTVKLISGLDILDIMIGFCSIDEFVQNGNHHHNRVKNGCFFYCYDGDVCFNEDEIKSYSSQLKVNDKITAIKTGTSIRFLINGVDQGEAINNAEGDMYPFVELCDVGDSVMIVPNP
jgi:phosphotransferase system HPr-like phosphotransfer protein